MKRLYGKRGEGFTVVHAKKFAMCSSKRPYESERMALRAVEDGTKRGIRNLSTYRCPICKRWHLTKQHKS